MYYRGGTTDHAYIKALTFHGTKTNIYNEEIQNLAEVAKRIIITMNKLEQT